MNTDPDFVELERLEIFHNYIGPYGDSVRLCRRLADRLRAAEAERDRLLEGIQLCEQARKGERKMDEKQIDEMVNRFLGWKLPKDFAPDAGISFKPATLPSTPMNYEGYWPVGTNLLNADQARDMIKHVLGLTHNASLSGLHAAGEKHE